MIEVCSWPAHLDYHDVKSVHYAAERIEGTWRGSVLVSRAVRAKD